MNIISDLRHSKLTAPELCEKQQGAALPVSVKDFILTLDKFSVLTGDAHVVDVISGKKFICELEFHRLNELLPTIGKDRLTKKQKYRKKSLAYIIIFDAFALLQTSILVQCSG